MQVSDPLRYGLALVVFSRMVGASILSPVGSNASNLYRRRRGSGPSSPSARFACGVGAQPPPSDVSDPGLPAVARSVATDWRRLERATELLEGSPEHEGARDLIHQARRVLESAFADLLRKAQIMGKLLQGSAQARPYTVGPLRR
jgi:hypothetical protein